MSDLSARALFLASAVLAASHAQAEPVTFEPCDALPAAVSALGGAGEPEAFGVAGGVAVASFASPTEAGRSVLKIARGADEPQSLTLSGRVLGLAISSDGRVAFAIVRVTDRKGAVRSVALTRVDLSNRRDSEAATLPATARGIAFGSNESTLLLAAANEIRTFQYPSLASGPLYRVLGENVGLVPVAGSSQILVAQSKRLVWADLAGTQGRDGLTLTEETASPGPLLGVMASAGDQGPTAMGEAGKRWCLRGVAAPRRSPAQIAAVEAAQAPPAPVEAPVPVEAPAPETSPVPVPAPPPAPPSSPAEAPAAVAESPGNPADSGTVSGRLEGPSLAEVAAIVVFGPDNILKEAARTLPDEQGRFSFEGLKPGAYRIVVSGKGGRVLICDPAFITVHVGGSGAVAAPVMKVLHAP